MSLNCLEGQLTLVYKWIIWHLESTLFLLDKVDALFWIFALASRRIFRGFSELVPGYAIFIYNKLYNLMDFLLLENTLCNLYGNWRCAAWFGKDK